MSGDWVEVPKDYFENREIDPMASPWVDGTHAWRAIAYGLVFMLWFSAWAV